MYFHSIHGDQGRVEAPTPPTLWGGPGLRGAQKGPGVYQSRARCAWGKKRGKKEKRRKEREKEKGKKEKEKKGEKTWGPY